MRFWRRVLADCFFGGAPQEAVKIRAGSKRKILITIIIAVILIALFALGLHLIEKHGLIDTQFGDTGGFGSDDDDEILITLDNTEYVSTDNVDTYLVMGTDAGTDDQGEAYSGQLADFLMLAIVDNTTEKYAFIEIDRNTMVDVQLLDENGEFNGYYKQQICLSRWYGTNEDERNENALAAVSTLFGDMDIDNYYAINMADIGAVNRAVGGVTVDIDSDLTAIDPAFEEGARVTLTDEQAEKYLRARMGVGEGTNKERMSRQTQYISSAYNMVMDQLRENPEYINDIYDQLDGKIEEGEGNESLSKLANQLIQYENLGIQQIAGETKLGDTQDDGIEHEEFYADNSSIAEILGRVMNLTSRPAEADDDAEDDE